MLEDGVNAITDCVGDFFEANHKKYISTKTIVGFFDNKIFKHEFSVKESLRICDEAVIVHLVGLNDEKESLEALINTEKYKQKFEWHSGPTEFENYLIKKSFL